MSRTPRFGRLGRLFLARLADNELLAADAESHQPLVTALALLAATSCVIALGLVAREALAGPEFDRFRAVTILSDGSLMISITMLAVVLATALAWDGLYPDKRDAMTLGVLPVTPRLMMQARMLAIVLYIAAVALAVNAFTGVVVPVLGAIDGALVELLRSFAGWTIAVGASAATVLFVQITLQGILLAVLPYSAYRRLSAVLQLCLVMGAFLAFFMTPGADQALRVPAAAGLRNPSWWFVGLYTYLRGGAATLPPVYALYGAAAVPVSGVAAFGIYAALYARLLHKVCEQADHLPSRSGWVRRALHAVLDHTVLRGLRERAVFYFLARTAVRNRRHRMLLALTTAIGFAWAGSTIAKLAARGWNGSVRPDALLLGVPIELAALLVIGLKTTFAVPVDLPANWTLRLTDRGTAAAVQSAAIWFLWLVGVAPVSLLPLPLYIALWGPATALIHCAFLLMGGAALAEWLIRGFVNMPFASAIQPGRGNLRVKSGAWVALFSFMCWWLAVIEEDLLQHPRRRLIGLGVVGGVWLLLAGLRLLRDRGRAIVYEEPLNQELDLLRLHT
jgi:hypothetical protein